MYSFKDISSINPEFLPSLSSLSVSKKISDKDNENSLFSYNIPYPRFSLGFQYYYHQTKDKMELTQEFTNKKKVYWVFNLFDKNIDDYNEDLNNTSIQYFNLKNSQLKLSFYKLWEINMMFNLISLDSDFKSIHFSDNLEPSIQSVLFYFNKFSKISKNKYYGYNLNIYKQKQIGKELNDKNIIIKSIDDLLKEKNIEKTLNKLEKDADLIITDGKVGIDNNNVEEQGNFKLLLIEIIMSLNSLKKNGNLVLRIYESFTDPTVKLLYLLNSFFDELYIYKPLTSRLSSSEKYIIGKKYKPNNNLIKNLLNIFDESNKSINLDKYIVDIYTKYNIPSDYLDYITKINSDIANKQFKQINLMIDFINQQNYRGEVYNVRRDLQINSSKFWINSFFIDPKNLSSSLSTFSNFVNNKK